jgi:hypothetical protein
MSQLTVLIISAMIGGLIGSFSTYYFNNKSKKERNQAITKQTMIFVHVELYDNLANNIIREYPYKILGIKGIDLINTSSGSLSISNQQMLHIVKIYTIINSLNGDIYTTIEASHHGRSIVKLHERTNKLQSKFTEEIEKYQKLYCSKKSIAVEAKGEIEIE